MIAKWKTGERRVLDLCELDDPRPLSGDDLRVAKDLEARGLVERLPGCERTFVTTESGRALRYGWEASVIAKCQTCGAKYLTGEAWDALPFVGIQHGGGMSIELRNCVCGSTLSVEIEDLVEVTGEIDAEFEAPQE